MPTHGTEWRKFRAPEATWAAASAAFPSKPGVKGGLSAELRAFVELLAEHPDTWKAVKARAEADGVEPWTLIADAVAAYRR